MNDEQSFQLKADSPEPGSRQETVRLNFDQIKPAPEKPQDKPRPKKKRSNLLLNLLIWIVVALVIVALGLVISAFIAGFNSVFEMLDWIVNEVL
ncbi:MAG: hypothetical protein FWE41_05035 [Coriobacteriia bacterium]|nr:hypothetical protein [Coriobacteriia bacterium]MCL2749789.1 hypothetical protein [Coriobacteriia bacterium]